jgi:hypothetical protein
MGGRRVGAARRRFLRSSSACVVLASVLLFGASLLWAVFVPGFRAPDELQHVNSVVRLAEGGGWPGPGDVRIEDETLGALAARAPSCPALQPRRPTRSDSPTSRRCPYPTERRSTISTRALVRVARSIR